MNKNIFDTLILFLISVVSYSQVSTDFTSYDCGGISHNLYSHLDNGHVVVICWVMPCGPCASGAEHAQNAVQSFDGTHPGLVKYFIVDDFANSDCNFLTAWNGSYQLFPDATFSNPSINMNDYGGIGMPKVVVIGPNKQVYYNGKNNEITQAAIIDGINQSLQVSNNLENNELNQESSFFYDNQNKLIQFYDTKIINYKIFSSNGELVDFSNSSNSVIDVKYLSRGLYIIKYNIKEKVFTRRFTVRN